MSAYNAAKAGLSAWTESLAYELRHTHIRVIDFRPGDLRTPFNQATAQPADHTPAWRRVWRRIEAMHATAPPPAEAARDLCRALQSRRSGMVRSGTIIQAHLAPLLARLAPWRLRHAIQARYFDL
jgi:NAD(P)-dependent dehydrogenase (short-subunit alcohol dehydrogenase family)